MTLPLPLPILLQSTNNRHTSTQVRTKGRMPFQRKNSISNSAVMTATTPLASLFNPNKITQQASTYTAINQTCRG